MRLAGLKSLLFFSAALVLAGFVSGCDNPFDPLDKSAKIEGLMYFDFSATQSHWDSDPEWDGLEVTLSYYNEFGDSLNFHDKPHKVQIEFWSENTDPGPPVVKSRGSLLISKTVEFSNSDDVIRIPIESYISVLSIADPPVAITGYLLVRLFPPEEYPLAELVRIQDSVEFYTPETAPL